MPKAHASYSEPAPPLRAPTLERHSNEQALTRLRAHGQLAPRRQVQAYVAHTTWECAPNGEYPHSSQWRAWKLQDRIEIWGAFWVRVGRCVLTRRNGRLTCTTGIPRPNRRGKRCLAPLAVLEGRGSPPCHTRREGYCKRRRKRHCSVATNRTRTSAALGACLHVHTRWVSSHVGSGHASGRVPMPLWCQGGWQWRCAGTQDVVYEERAPAEGNGGDSTGGGNGAQSPPSFWHSGE